MRLTRAFLLGGLCTLSACATGPTPVAGVPGANKDPASFQKDELACRTAAGQAVYPAASSDNKTPAPVSPNSNAQWQAFFAAYTQCQTSKGNSVVAIPWTAAYADYLGYFAPSGYGAPGYAYAYGYGYPAYDPFLYNDAFFWGDPFFFGLYGPYGYGYGRYGFGYGGHFGGGYGHFGGGYGHFGGGFHGGGGHH